MRRVTNYTWGARLLHLMVAAWLFAPAAANSEGDNPMIALTTNFGVIEIELYPDKAPLTVANFIAYVETGHFDGLTFHRVIPGFMIQGGGLTPDLQERQTREPIENEADNGLKNLAGALSMARTSAPHSATSQFFINLVDNEFLDHQFKSGPGWGYAVFARVTRGMDVVNNIAAVETGQRGPHADVPLEPVMIERAEIIEK